MELTVTRTYKVTLPDDKDYELKLDDKDYPFAELVSACVDEYETGQTSGTLLYVAGDMYFDVDNQTVVEASDLWINKKEYYAEKVLRECDYTVQFIDEVID